MCGAERVSNIHYGAVLLLLHQNNGYTFLTTLSLQTVTTTNSVLNSGSREIFSTSDTLHSWLRALKHLRRITGIRQVSTSNAIVGLRGVTRVALTSAYDVNL